VLRWVAVRLHDSTGDDLGKTLLRWPVELGDEITVAGQQRPLEVVDIVRAPPGAKVTAIVKVRAAGLYAV